MAYDIVPTQDHRILGGNYWGLWTSCGLSNLGDGMFKVGLPLVAIGLLRGMGAPALSPSRRPIERPLRLEEPPAPRTLEWIAADRKYIDSALKQQRQAVLLAPVFMIVMVLVLVGMYGADVAGGTLWALVGIMGALLLVFVSVLVHAGKGLCQKLESIRVGVSPDGFHFVAPSTQTGKIVEGGPVAWRDVFFDGRRLLAGRQALLAKMPTGAEVFERATFEREILARIPKANFVGPGGLAWRELKNASFGMQVTYGVGFAVAVIMLILTFTRR